MTILLVVRSRDGLDKKFGVKSIGRWYQSLHSRSNSGEIPFAPALGSNAKLIESIFEADQSVQVQETGLVKSLVGSQAAAKINDAAKAHVALPLYVCETRRLRKDLY